MPARHVEITVGVEPEVAVGMASDLDEGLTELFGLAGAGAATEGEGDLHLLRQQERGDGKQGAQQGQQDELLLLFWETGAGLPV